MIELQNINSFLDSIEREIEEARDKIIMDNQTIFEAHVKKLLKKGDRLFVANGTAFLKREKRDNTNDESLEKITESICKGVWEICFDYPYKTEV